MKRLIQQFAAISMLSGGLVCFLMLPAGAGQASPCANDLKQFCGDVTPGGGRILACYEKQKTKMSAACRAWAEGAKSAAASIQTACSKEIALACNAEKGDPLEMLDCLQGQYISLSPDCVETLNRFKYQYPQVTNPQ